MKRKFFVTLFGLVLIIALFICNGAGGMGYPAKYKKPASKPVVQETTQAPTKEPVKPEKVTPQKAIALENGTASVIAVPEENKDKLYSFYSDNPSVVSVDDGGMIEALSEGKTTVYAVYSDKTAYSYEVTAEPAQKSKYDGYSTAILGDTETEQKNLMAFTKPYTYSIKVNRKMNTVTVYTYDSKGDYTIPVRAMVSSCGANNGTITGDFDTYFTHEWHALYDNCYGYYVSGIDGDYLFHSVPYYEAKSDSLEVDEYNKLGTSASLGCVRLAAADSKWIYENCSVGTHVTIYDSDDAGPLGKPASMHITDTGCGWDPTDDSPQNPYHNKVPEISGVQNITIKKGDTFSPLSGAGAKDTCGNDITDRIKVTHNVDTSREGSYRVRYFVEDDMHRTMAVTITVNVAK